MNIKTKHFFLTIVMLFYGIIFNDVVAQSIQVEAMTIGGPYAGVITTPFSGVAFYGNGDKVDGGIALSNVTGQYDVAITGASSSDANAQIDLYIEGSKVGVFNFGNTSISTETKSISINSNTASKTIQLILSTDSGSNDTFIDKIVFTYKGAVLPPRQAPTLPITGAFDSGVYRNMFVESGKNTTAVSNKLTQMWNQFFVSGDANSGRLLYNVGTDMAYILDTGNDDIRSEGQSYGMMICVQLDKKAEFDKLWKFAKTYSQHPAGNAREGLFSWKLSKSNYSKTDDNSAPDGEEYYVTALFFAHARWGSTGTFNYKAEADYILDSMLNKPAANSGSCPTDLVDTTEKQVVFGICGNSATFTDPSYHLPAFYEIWARYAKNNKQLWADMAIKSRTYLLPRAANPTTGLMPDYSLFDGTPKNDGDHGKFEYDAWRNIMNMGVDQAWFKKSSAEITPLINRQIDFFKNKPNYASLWTLDGTFSRTTDHSPGLVGCNAVGSLALADAKVWPFIDELFDTPIPSGQYRYYDGLLYMMSYMHLSGNFKAYKDGVPLETFTITASAGANGTISPTGAVVVDKGTSKEFIITPNSGYDINTITVNGAIIANTSTYTFTNVVANQNIAVTFKVKPPVETFTITASAGANGTISPIGAVVVDKGTNKIFTITPNTGYDINTITVNGAVVANVSTYTFTSVVANQTIAVTFKVKPPVETFTITASAGANGTISPTGAVVVDKGTNKTFTITPSAGYEINTITVNGAVVTNVSTYTFTNILTNQSISVTFRAVIVGSDCLLVKFGVPRTSALPSKNSTFKYVYVLGTGGPNASTITMASFNWDLQNNGLYDFSFNFNTIPWYTGFSSATIKNLAATSGASVTIKGSGVLNFENNKYYVNLIGNDVVFVEVTGKHAVYFSNTATAPVGCNTTAAIQLEVASEQVKFASFPNPSIDAVTVSIPGKAQNKEVTIKDMSGLTIIEQKLDSSKEDHIIDVKNIKSGTYLIIIKSDNKTQVKRMIKTVE
jgi:endo-1,4-beta-D-glucanase Y